MAMDVPMRVSHGIRNAVRVISDPAAWWAVCTWPKFSLTSYRIVSSLHRQGFYPTTIVDVGANVGQFTIAAAKFFPAATIYSFEPVPAAVRLLRSNCAGFSQVKIFGLAVGSHSGEVEIRVNRNSVSSSVLPLGDTHRQAFPESQESYVCKVPMATLDGVLPRGFNDGPVLLKLDVQGLEAPVIEGAEETLQYVDYILIETSFRDLYEGEMLFPEMMRLLESKGFEFLRPMSWLKDPRTGEVLQMDVLFVRKPSRSAAPRVGQKQVIAGSR